MKPPPFSYAAPTTLDEALAVLAQYGDDVSVLGGGQSLMPLLNMRLARPDILLDVNRLPELDYVREAPGGGFAVGALTRLCALEQSPDVRSTLPVVPEALSHVGHPQIRNRTTVGGNVAHADPSSELPCVLAALDGEVVLSSNRGTRRVRWDEFFVSVFTTCREPDELVTEIRLPAPAGWQFRFTEFARRGGDFPLAAMAVGTTFEEGQLGGLRVAVTGVGERVARLEATEDLGLGLLDHPLVERLATSAREEITPSADSSGSGDYRRALVATLLSRSLSEMAWQVAA